jgi:hypothetical protein
VRKVRNRLSGLMKHCWDPRSAPDHAQQLRLRASVRRVHSKSLGAEEKMVASNADLASAIGKNICEQR